MNGLNLNGQALVAALRASKQQSSQKEAELAAARKIHVVGAGRTLTSAYEQLRNAAENTEEHLLLQQAIRRFYKRLFLAGSQNGISSSGEELITELTLAGYIANDSISADVTSQLDRLTADYHTAYSHLHEMGRHASASNWTIAVLALEVESLLNDHGNRDAFLQFAFDDFKSSIDSSAIYGGNVPADYELSLYVAVHRALLKSDNATIRWAILRRFQQNPSQLSTYIQANEKIDELLDTSSSEKLFRIVNRNGAALRILWRMLGDRDNVDELLTTPEKFLAAYESQINTEYDQINARINRGVIKSVIFLIITKFLIGISIEVPYDYLAKGEIIWLPLIINLLAPPLYMILLRLTLTMPSPANTRALVAEAETLLYVEQKPVLIGARRKKQYGATFNAIYALLFVVVFGLVGWGLVSLGFTWVHLAIFFVFFSTASFLGFRLSRTIREIEAVDSEQSGLSLVRDFLYMPFVVVGRWMSDKYSRVNVVAVVLDMIIELPMKTVLRLIRQWGAFISTKKDEL